jgi:L-arabinokinase
VTGTGAFSESDAIVTSAPGRLDVMGGIADYSGSLVLQRPIAERTTVTLRRHRRPTLEIESSDGRSIAIALDTLAPAGEPITYDAARDLFADDSVHWAAYVAGLFVVLMRERGVPITSGLRITIDSQVPEGTGVSSSAALETAAMAAMAQALDVPMTAAELAALCQKAENLVAGAPCGIMDQMACVFGEPESLMALLCRPATLQPPVAIPTGIEFWGLDSGERHFVGPSASTGIAGSPYAVVRAAAFMGLRMIAARARAVDAAGPGPGVPAYLAQLTPAEFEASALPDSMSGAEFLQQYGATSDAVTHVVARVRYPVRQCAAHPVYEHARVTRFRDLLAGPDTELSRCDAGELMYESHASYRACGLASPGTDRLVDLVRDAGHAAGLYGARITGGGSGGTVVVMGRRDARPAIDRLAARYAVHTGHRPHIFTGSSPGLASSWRRATAGPSRSRS